MSKEAASGREHDSAMCPKRLHLGGEHGSAMRPKRLHLREGAKPPSSIRGDGAKGGEEIVVTRLVQAKQRNDSIL